MPARILVVDDDPGVRKVLTLQLAAKGFQVAAVASGEDALLACSPRVPDVVILDVSMPGMDGYQVCERLREAVNTPLSIIFLTGTFHGGTTCCFKKLIHQSGGDYFMVKPYDQDVLLGLIGKICTRSDQATSSRGEPENSATLQSGQHPQFVA